MHIETTYFKLITAPEFDISGYHILYATNQVKSIAEMSKVQLHEFADVLQQAQQEIQQTIQPEKIYLLSFCEVLADFHLHLFPRTASMLAEFRKQLQLTETVPPDGARLFAWAREYYRKR